MSLPARFAERVLDWHGAHGRHDLPWQHPRTPYRVWVAEIMLQQTQVATVRPYFLRFVEAFPDLGALAAADEESVLAMWSGLGYYRRARHLHVAARRCMQQHGGALPENLDELAALPGIGRSTAAAILAQAHGQRHAILDGNARRLLCRLFAVEGWPGAAAVERELWRLAEALLPERKLADYTQAIMDLGATVCTRHRPACAQCPLAADCAAFAQGRVAELPVARPPRTLPTRACAMLVLSDAADRVLLVRRPPRGVWGGLWSLPEFEHPDAACAWAEREYASDQPPALLPPFRHAFSHYRLQVQPLRLTAGPALRIADDDDRRWVAPELLATLGLPAPVRRLLASACRHRGVELRRGA